MRRWIFAAIAVLLLGAAFFGTLQLRTAHLSTGRASLGDSTAPVNPNTIAVMDFKNQRNDPDNDWCGDTLKSAINTELSKIIPQISVIAPEVIRATVVEEGVDVMKAARLLGVQHFVVGDYRAIGREVRIDARIVDTERGTLKAAVEAEGSLDDFLTLQRQVTVAILARLSVDLSEAQEQALTKSPKVRANKYHQMLETEGMTKPRGSGGPDPDSQAFGPQSRAKSPIHMRAWMHPFGLLVSAAHAQDAPTEIEQGVHELLADYEEAQSQGDVDRLAALHESFPESKRRAVAEYLKDIDDLHVEVTDVRIQPRAQNVLVSYTRRDSFADKETGEAVRLEVRVTKFLVHDGDRWKFAADE